MKTVLVTGADRGFGFCISKEFLRLGYTVFAGKYLDDYSLLETLAEKFPGKLYPVQMNMESRQSILAAYEEVKKYTDRLDVLVSNAAFMGAPPSASEALGIARRPEGYRPPDLKDHMIDIELAEKTVRINALGALQCTEIFLPLFENGNMKRLCYVSSEVSSINQMLRDADFRYPMSKTALNMSVRMLHNTLYPKGYTFRLYHPGWMRRMLPDGAKSPGDSRQIDPEFSAARGVEFITRDRPDEQRLVMVDYLGSIWPF